jgi:hypothetical protein
MKIPDTLAAWDSPARAVLPEVQYADTSAQEAADVRTRAARQAIKALEPLDELDALSLLHAMVSAFSTGRILPNSERGAAACEYLLDAVHVLENGV